MIVTKPQWLIVADKRTEMKWSRLFDPKNGMVDHVSRQFHKWKYADMPVKIVICDKTGKNKTIEKCSNCAKCKLSLEF